MGSISGIIEGAYLLGGTPALHICTEEGRNLVIKSAASHQPIIHTGSNANIYNDVMRTPGEMTPEDDLFLATYGGSIISSGENVRIDTNGQENKITSLGEKCEINYGYWLDLDQVAESDRVMRGNKTYMGGDDSTLVSAKFAFQDSLIMSAGDKNTIIIDAGIDPDAKSQGNKILASGESSNIQITDDSVAVSVGADSTVTVGSNSVILSSESSTTFTVGQGSCAAVVWHDGTRKRVKVVYEGENGILADTQYTIDQSGNVVAV